MYAYQQVEYSDCGYACIRMICRHYGWRISPDYLREISDYNRLGLSIAEMKVTMERLGLDCATVKVKLHEVDFMPLPAILYWNSRHFVVLAGFDSTRRVYEILDPAEGRMKLREEDFKDAFLSPDGSGIALVVEDTPRFISIRDTVNRYESRMGLWHLLKNSFLSNRKSFFCVFLFTVFALAADIALPFIFQRTIDQGISSRDIKLVWLLVLGQLMVFLGSYVANCVIEIVLTRVGLKLGLKMLNEYLYRLVRLPMSFFSRKVSSDLIQKAEDHNRIKNFMLSVPSNLFFSILSIVVFSALLVVFSPLIFLIFIVITLISLGWTTMFLGFRREVDSSLVAKSAENRNNLYELIDGIDEIKANNAHLSRVKIWNELQEKINRLSVKATFYRLYQSGGNSLLVRLRDILIMGLCACLVIDGSMTIGLMMTVSYIVGRLSVPFNSFLNSINEVQDANLSYRRIEEIHDATVSPVEPDCSPLMPECDITFSGVTFKYPGAGSPYVLNNINLTIPRGKTTALVGASGSGKSTLIKLIISFFTPVNGLISVGNVDLSTLPDNVRARHFGVVLQNGKIFSGTILANIALCDEVPDIQRARLAASIACIDEFIARLPLGFHTRIGKTGLELSGGQQQRILIARAIYLDPDILILDEATSAMDAITEASIMENIYRYFRGKTLIIAAHRLSTVRVADNIVVISDGSIAEHGNHIQLMERQGVYSRLVNRQI